MDVVGFTEKVLPTANVEHGINSQMPHLQKVLKVDASIDSKQDFLIDKEPGSLRDKSPITFLVYCTPGFFLDMGSFYLDVELKLTTPAFGNPPGGAEAYFINNIGQTMFSGIRVFLNDVNVQSTFHNSQISNLIQILTTSNMAIDNFGEVQGAFKCTHNTHPEEILQAHLRSEEIAPRVAWSKKRPRIKLRVPLNLDIGTADKYLVDGVDLRIELQLA